MKIEWTEPALLDLESIRGYIRRDSQYYAARFVEKIIEAIDNLKAFPEMGRHVPEAEDKNMRELMLQNYRIIYRAESERMLIIAVIHGARDFSHLKLKPWDIV